MIASSAAAGRVARAVLFAGFMLGSVESAGAQAVDTVRVTVHNHGVALYVTHGTGPVVVMEAGGGSSHRVWNTVVGEISRFARVVTYDRPGYGLSAACDSPRTADRIARELRHAIREADIDGPYTMVGWSYGGAIVRVFSGNFPGEVSGLVLVDPSPEDFYSRAAREFPDLMAQEEESYLPALYTDSMRRAEQRETAGYPSSMEQARASDDNHSTPTILLIAGRDGQGAPDPLSRLWIDELERWGARRPNTESRVVAGAGHHIAKDKPEAVIGAVRELVNRGPPDRSWRRSRRDWLSRTAR